MRIALLADIHGNLTALEAVLADLASEQVDQLVCLGDVAIFGPQPRATLARLRGLACPVVMGNTDAWALDPHPHAERDAESALFNAIELWGAAQLEDVDRAYLRTFQPMITVDLGAGRTLLAYHGSPRSFHDPIFATTPDAELAGWLGEARATILAGGHTHVPFVRRFQQSLVINPGSVGLPFESTPGGKIRNPPWAEYALLEASGESVRVELRRTPVELAKVRSAVQASGMPFADWWLEDWFAVSSRQ